MNDENVNGNLTMGENIADNGGIKQSFAEFRAAAARKRQSTGTDGARLPGLPEYTPEQLFFLSYAQVWARILCMQWCRVGVR